MSALLLVWLYGHSSNTVTVQSVSSRHHLPLPTKWKASSPESVIPWVIDTQDSCAGTIAGAAGHRIVPCNQIAVKFQVITVQIQGPLESDSTVVGVKFEPDSRSHDEAARRKRSRVDRYRSETGRIESGGSCKSEATVQIGGTILIEAARHTECLVPRRRERAVQRYLDINQDAGDSSCVAAGTAAVDGVVAGEGVNVVGRVDGDRPSESNHLSFNRCGGEGYVAASQGTSQADGGQTIKACRTIQIHCRAYQTTGLLNAAGYFRWGPTLHRRSAELPIA